VEDFATQVNMVNGLAKYLSRKDLKENKGYPKGKEKESILMSDDESIHTWSFFFKLFYK